MAWFIKADYRDTTGQRRELTEQIPVLSDAAETLAGAFRRTIARTLGDALDDESDLTVTVAYVGQRTPTEADQVRR